MQILTTQCLTQVAGGAGRDYEMNSPSSMDAYRVSSIDLGPDFSADILHFSVI